jgi:hypothetical protein
MSWQQEAASALLSLASTGEPFSSDDLLDAVGFPDDDHTPNAGNNAIGSVFRKASADGVIVPVGVTRSKVPTRKGGLVRTWQGVDRTDRLW